MSNLKVTYVYDNKLMKFLRGEGISYICTAKAISTDKQFWLYIDNEELQKGIKNFNQVKQAA